MTLSARVVRGVAYGRLHDTGREQASDREGAHRGDGCNRANANQEHQPSIRAV